MSTPERAVVIEHGDALRDGNELRVAFGGDCFDERDDGLLAPSFHDGSGSVCACATVPQSNSTLRKTSFWFLRNTD